MFKNINQDLKETYKEHYRIAIYMITIRFVIDWVNILTLTYYTWIKKGDFFPPIIFLLWLLIQLIEFIDQRRYQILE